jgi:hypothetical protein
MASLAAYLADWSLGKLKTMTNTNAETYLKVRQWVHLLALK